jgi:hypothetical protein
VTAYVIRRTFGAMLVLLLVDAVILVMVRHDNRPPLRPGPSSEIQRRAGDAPRVNGPLVMTYWEAKAAGFHVPPLPSETGMQVCTDADLGSGFPSAEAAERALAEYEATWGDAGSSADCQLDPTKRRRPLP